ncbi:MAG: hypothetical protein QXF17_01355 [Ignisphaera sp.]
MIRYYKQQHQRHLLLLPQTRGSTTITIAQQATVDPTKSTITFTPSTVSWGYGKYVVVRGTIRDSNNNPLPNISVLYVRLYTQNGSTVIYNDSTAKTTTSTGEVQYTISVDSINSSYVPQNAIVELGVQSGSTVVRIRASSNLGITGKATTVTVSTDKTTYNYGENITLSFALKDSAGNTVVDAPVYVRIVQGTTVVKDFGQVFSAHRNGSSTTIAVNTTNFPSAGSYTIEVADNSTYSAAAVVQQIDLSAIITPVLIIAILTLFLGKIQKVMAV